MRKSRQRGWIELRGKKWYGYFRKTVIDPTTNEQRRMTATVILGFQAHMDKAEAREMLDSTSLNKQEFSIRMEVGSTVQ